MVLNLFNIRHRPTPPPFKMEAWISGNGKQKEGNPETRIEEFTYTEQGVAEDLV